MSLMSLFTSSLVKKRGATSITHIRLVIICLIIWTTGAYANSQLLTINKYIENSISNSNEIEIQKKRIAIQKAEHQIAIAGLLPKLDAGFGLNSIDYDVDGRDPLARINVLGDDMTVYPVAPSEYSSSLDLSLSQTLFAGGRILAQVRLKSLELKQSTLGYEVSLSKKQSELSSLYWMTLIADYEKKSSDKLTDLTKTKFDFLKSKSDKGFLNKKKLRESEIDFSNRKENKKLKNQILIQAKNQLIKKSILSYSSIQLSSLPNESEDIESYFQRLQSLAFQYEPFSVRRSKIDIEIQNKKHAISKSLFMPEITLSAGMDYFDANNSFKKAFDDLKHGNTYAQLSVRYNLFSGFKNIANLKKTHLEKQIAALTLSTEQDNFQVAIENLIQNCQKALATFEQSKKNFDSMTSLLSEAHLQFKHNQISKADIIDTQIHHAETEILHKKALIDVEI
ncbi:hypothetical protein DID76_04260, partial [Candidatus Marinamargulisbacteria bacterium SCGC AG-414-C22]